MSDTPSNDKPVEKKKSPLELVKERQNALRQNRGSKTNPSAAGGDKASAPGDAPVAKPMRSSASKQGG
jgi:hypothetical protein